MFLSRIQCIGDSLLLKLLLLQLLMLQLCQLVQLTRVQHPTHTELRLESSEVYDCTTPINNIFFKARIQIPSEHPNKKFEQKSKIIRLFSSILTREYKILRWTMAVLFCSGISHY